MASAKEELKVRLMAEAEAAIERMLEKRSSQEHLTITDIERLARRVGQDVMGAISQRLAEEEKAPRTSSECPRCGRKMKDKGLKGRTIISETGEVRVERRYYYCAHCQSGIFPPG